MRPRWEYTTVTLENGARLFTELRDGESIPQITAVDTGAVRLPVLSEYLNKLGKEGWEVCGVIPAIPVNASPTCIVLKRPADR